MAIKQTKQTVGWDGVGWGGGWRGETFERTKLPTLGDKSFISPLTVKKGFSSVCNCSTDNI